MNLEEIRNPILRGLLLQYTGYEFPDKVISSIRMLIFPWDTLSLRVCLHCGRTIRIKGIMALPGLRLLAYCGACGCSKHRHKSYQELLDSIDDIPPDQYLLYSILPENEPTIIFGDGRGLARVTFVGDVDGAGLKKINKEVENGVL